MPRLFAAIEIPDEIAAGLERLRQPLPGARWLEPQSYHLTLRFFGDVTAPVAREIGHELALVEHPVMEIRCTEPGVFGGADPRALWVGIDGGEPLAALQRDVERAARRAGLAPEKRPFRPHVTLARLHNSNVDVIARYLGRHGAFRSPPFTATRFVLMSSRAFTGGGPYGVVEEYPLIGGGWGDDAADYTD
ncbi:MAG: RNA 2',3'-cyclic phosphodiesterase [Hyphomicrobiaceae bacterium]